MAQSSSSGHSGGTFGIRRALPTAFILCWSMPICYGLMMIVPGRLPRSSMTAISVPSSQPLDPRTADALRRIFGATEGQPFDPMLVRALGASHHARACDALPVRETGSHSECPLAQELRRIVRGDFIRARQLLRSLLAGMEAGACA